MVLLETLAGKRFVLRLSCDFELTHALGEKIQANSETLIQKSTWYIYKE